MDEMNKAMTWKPGRIAVVGDIMVDRYWSGDVDRISPEAPVPVVLVKHKEDRLGGAANVALNGACLGATVDLVGVVGNDDGARIIKAIAAKANVIANLITDEGYETTVKLRVLGRRQQMVRLDFESRPNADAIAAQHEVLSALLPDVNVLVISDYAKGGLAAVEQLIDAARKHNVIVIVDPKGSDYRRYSGATVITPNRGELMAVVGPWIDEGDLTKKAQRLREDLGIETLLLTRSEEGMSVFNQYGVRHYPTEARAVFDVSGAGDTVVATLAVCLSANMDIETAVPIANRAAGVVVGKVGTATVSVEELFGVE
jgi:rfaE bifunctional protein kinase chain/domain